VHHLICVSNVILSATTVILSLSECMYMFRRGHSLFGKEIMWFNFCNHVTFVGRIQPVAPLKVLHIYKDFFFFFTYLWWTIILRIMMFCCL